MQPVLAQYTIRSKQEYIFKTNKIVEIAGASSHIRDAWEYLFSCAKEIGMLVERNATDLYDHDKTLEKFETKELQLVELFCGGGNETVIFDDITSYLKLNKAFSYYLLKNCPGMIPMACCVSATGDYKTDYSRLMKTAEIEKNKMTSGQDYFVLPFSMMDRDTCRPMTRLDTIEGTLHRYSEESYSKRVKGIEERNKDRAIKILDSMVTQKGKESLLAVVHADGNNMGSKIMDMLHNKTTYDECVNLMRRFTSETAKAFGKHGLNAIEEQRKKLLEKNAGREDALCYRVLIKDGDDMTFICNARYVMEYTAAYIKAVQEYESEWQYSSCAGICIFHSHYPVSKAYELAEQACDDGAKNKVHQLDENGQAIAIEEGWVDFHYIHSGIGGNLEEIRKIQNTEKCMARPWLVVGENDTRTKLESLYKLNDLVKNNNIARTSIKTIGSLAEESTEIGLREFRKLINHLPKTSTFVSEMKKLFGDEKCQLKALYDYAEVYDLWFTEDK